MYWNLGLCSTLYMLSRVKSISRFSEMTPIGSSKFGVDLQKTYGYVNQSQIMNEKCIFDNYGHFWRFLGNFEHIC